LAQHVKQFGKDCYDKFVPQTILNATPSQIRIFLDYYVMGDGRITDRVNRRSASKRRGRLMGVHTSITTTSRRMADHIQELYQKLGYAASIYTRKAHSARMQHVSMPRADGTSLAYDYVSEKRDCYSVYSRGATAVGFTIEETTYSGMIGCATVPNGTLLVRRNDKIVWSGNSEAEIAVLTVQAFQSAIQLNSDTFSRSSLPNGMMLLKGDFFNQNQIDALMREWTNMKRGVSKAWGMPVMSVPEEAEVEIVNFMDMKGQEIRYKDHLNLMGGLYCIIAQFPARRLGIFASGNTRDNEPTKNESVEQAGVDDPGLPPLLGFVANRVNEYLLWPNWPRLRLRFNGANPKQDAREYEARQKARTWGESRRHNDEKPLESLASKENKPLMEIMALCPEDSSKQGSFQTLAVKWLEMRYGEKKENGEGGMDRDTERVGAPFPSKTDPAKSEEHGHRSGVRRNSAAETASAEANR
jgi:hypothetical protein